MRHRENRQFYEAVLRLRRAGYKVYRAGNAHSHLDRRWIENAEVMRRAAALRRPPVQLNLFDWRPGASAATSEVA